MDDEIQVTKDVNGNILIAGDTVISTQNLMAGKMKIQKGTKVKNIRLTDTQNSLKAKSMGLGWCSKPVSLKRLAKHFVPTYPSLQ